MSETHKEPKYMSIWWALLALTVIEVAIGSVHQIPQIAKVVALVVLALWKAGLVAAYFMHLKFEKRMLAVIVGVPLILSAILLIGTTPDATSPGLIKTAAPKTEHGAGH